MEAYAPTHCSASKLSQPDVSLSHISHANILRTILNSGFCGENTKHFLPLVLVVKTVDQKAPAAVRQREITDTDFLRLTVNFEFLRVVKLASVCLTDCHINVNTKFKNNAGQEKNDPPLLIKLFRAVRSVSNNLFLNTHSYPEGGADNSVQLLEIIKNLFVSAVALSTV